MKLWSVINSSEYPDRSIHEWDCYDAHLSTFKTATIRTSDCTATIRTGDDVAVLYDNKIAYARIELMIQLHNKQIPRGETDPIFSSCAFVFPRWYDIQVDQNGRPKHHSIRKTLLLNMGSASPTDGFQPVPLSTVTQKVHIVHSCRRNQQLSACNTFKDNIHNYSANQNFELVDRAAGFIDLTTKKRVH